MAIINDRAQFAIKLLQQYAEQNQLPIRSTSDLSPLEEFLILRAFDYADIAEYFQKAHHEQLRAKK